MGLGLIDEYLQARTERKLADDMSLANFLANISRKLIEVEEYSAATALPAAMMPATNY